MPSFRLFLTLICLTASGNAMSICMNEFVQWPGHSGSLKVEPRPISITATEIFVAEAMGLTVLEFYQLGAITVTRDDGTVDYYAPNHLIEYLAETYPEADLNMVGIAFSPARPVTPKKT